MPTIDVTVSCPVHDSFRVRQVAGLFDVPLGESSAASFSVEIPGLDEPWQIGAIVGPSGSGKSTVAQAAFGDRLFRGRAWPADRAVIDGFGDLPTRNVTHMLTAVGFSSPPAWIKPYHVLSQGEKFRCDLAWALLWQGYSVTRSEKDADTDHVVAFDEFTSVVDRTVAQIGSAAVAKAIRRAEAGSPRFVAVTCHYDVLPWLEPDWVLDMATRTLQRRRLRRPSIELEVHRCRHTAWRLFAPHHYLSGDLNRAARCYLATWRDEPVAFAALLSAVGRRGVWRVSRIVVLPDYQGIGIGGRFLDALGEVDRREGLRTTITTGHGAMIGYLRRSPSWHVTAVSLGGNTWGSFARRKNIHSTSHGRAVVSAEFTGPHEK